MKTLEDSCYEKACQLIRSGVAYHGTDVFQLTDLLIKLELEKDIKNQLTDQNITFNDPIVSIEDVGVMETVDISVSGDNLFFCNGILTKNSFGLPATADLMFALIRSEQLDEMDQIMVKQLKNRYADPTSFKRFVLGVDRAKMKLFDVEDSAQQDIADSGHTDSVPVFDNSNIGKKIKQNDFNSFKF